MNRFLLKVLGLSGLLLGGCATVVDAQAPAVPEYVIRPALQPSHRADLMYQVLLAELAGKRDRLDVALTNYRQAAVAPRDRGGAGYDVLASRAALEAAAPSWPLSAHAEAMLLAWATPDVHAWVAESRTRLAAWKADLLRRLSARGFEVRPSVTPYVVVRPPRPVAPSLLRRHHVAVRDATSFGLPGWWRLSAQAPSAQDALMHALDLLDGGLP